MKKQVGFIFVLFFFLVSILPVTANSAAVNEPLQKIAVIIDSPEFYHSSYTDDIINGFRYINQTYQIDFDIFQLTNYSLISENPYKADYTYNGTLTNQTQLADSLIQTNQYDLIVVIGYELRRSFDVSAYPTMNFVFYDLAGEFPQYEGGTIPDNLFVVNFRENEQAFLLGSLAVAKFVPLPSKIGIVGFWKGDARTRQLISGFQSAIFRNTTNVDMSISYLDTWVDRKKVEAISSDLTSQNVKLVFSALQANDTLVMLNSLSSPGTNVVCVDLNQSMSVMKNNTRVLTDIFKTFNNSDDGFFGGVSATFGLTDDIFYTHGWADSSLVNKTIVGLHEDLVSGDLVIPIDIKYASNTPNISFLMIILVILPLLSQRKKRNK